MSFSFNRLFCFLILGTFSPNLFAQSTLDYVPESAMAVFRVNPALINQKMDIAEIQQLEMFDMVLEQMTSSLPPEQQAEAYKILTSPSQYGMDLLQPYCFFMAPGVERLNLFGMVLELSNTTTFSEAISKQLTGMAPETNMVQREGFVEYSLGNNMYLVWNEQVAMIASGQVETDYSNYWDLTEEELAQQEEENAQMIQQGVANLINRGFGNAINKNNKYQQSTANSSDLHFWMDYESLMDLGTSMAGGLGAMSTLGMGGYMEMLQGYYKDMDLDMGIEFVQGAMKMKVNLFADENLLEIYEEGYDKKLNKDFLKYIDGESTIGYAFWNMDFEEVMEATFDYLKPLIAEIPEYGEMGLASMEVLGIAIDEEALYDLVAGDVLFTFNGIKETSEEVTTYEYDEDFNPTETTKTLTKQIPQISFFMGYENGQSWQKILNLGMKFGMVQQSGGVYTLSNVPDLEDLELHLRLQDGIMVVSNDKDFVQNKAAIGFAQGLDKAEKKKWKKNAQVIKLDLGKLIEMSKAMGEGEPELKMMAEAFEKVGFSTMEVNTRKEIDGKVQTEMSFNLSDQETNALRSFMRMLNDAFLEQMGGERM